MSAISRGQAAAEPEVVIESAIENLIAAIDRVKKIPLGGQVFLTGAKLVDRHDRFERVLYLAFLDPSGTVQIYHAPTRHFFKCYSAKDFALRMLEVQDG